VEIKAREPEHAAAQLMAKVYGPKTLKGVYTSMPPGKLARLTRKDFIMGEAVFYKPLTASSHVMGLVKSAELGQNVVGLSYKRLGGQTSYNPREALTFELAEQLFLATLVYSANKVKRDQGARIPRATYAAGPQPVASKFGSTEHAYGQPEQALLTTASARLFEVATGLPHFGSGGQTRRNKRLIIELGGAQRLRHAIGATDNLMEHNPRRAQRQLGDVKVLDTAYRTKGRYKTMKDWQPLMLHTVVPQSGSDKLKGIERTAYLIELASYGGEWKDHPQARNDSNMMYNWVNTLKRERIIVEGLHTP